MPATLTVTTITDENLDNSTLSLREAILAVNNGGFGTGGNNQELATLTAGTVTGTFGDNDTIVFDNGALVTDLSGQTMYIGNTGQRDQMEIKASVVIDGTDLSSALIIDGEDDTRVFEIDSDGDSAVVTIDTFILQNGSGSSGGNVLVNDATDTLYLKNSTISGADASSRGGGLNNNDGTVFIENCDFLDNHAENTGGGIYNSGTLTIDDSLISGSTSDYAGTGILNTGTLYINNSTIDDNQMQRNDYGGGIYNGTGALASITNSTISNNLAGRDGGGIFNKGTLTILNSTISDNEADTTNSVADGGGIMQRGTLTLINSTVSGNESGGAGGGIWTNKTSYIINSTIYGNTSNIKTNAGQGGGIYSRFDDSVYLYNSIVIGNTDTRNAQGQDLGNGQVQSNGYNIIGDSTGSVIVVFGTGTDITDVETGDVIETTLADNGGPTLTHALLETSPARDAGNNDDALDDTGTELTTDQRVEFPRISNDTVDIGSFEYYVEPEPDPDPDPEPDAGSIASDVGDSTFAAFYVTLTGEDISLDDITVTNGVARQLEDNGDGSFTVIIAPDAIGTVTVAAPDLTADTISTEFSSLSFGATSDDFVQNLYTVIFAREASFDEVAYWTTQIANGATRTDILAGFLASDEYTSGFADNSALVDGLYQLLFDRAADDSYWTDQLSAGASLETVLTGILSSEEYFSRVVQETYNEFLLRPADDAGEAYWVDELLAGNLNVDQVRVQFESSVEAESV